MRRRWRCAASRWRNSAILSAPRRCCGAQQAYFPSLSAKVVGAARIRDTPAARLIGSGEEPSVRVDEIESALVSCSLFVDACRRAVCAFADSISLETRAVLFLLARALVD